MFLFTGARFAARRFYKDLDYARHFPKAYVDRMKFVGVPKKIYDNRFGAAPVVHYVLPPDDCTPFVGRPWEQENFTKLNVRSEKYFEKKLSVKYFNKRVNRIKRIPDEEWTFFAGDLVQIMVGKDKGSKGIVSHVIRDANAVFVDGHHMTLSRQDAVEQIGMDAMYNWKMQPLFVDKDQVRLIDPNDNEPCTAKWMLNETKTDYVRVSKRTGYIIPMPSQAVVTYEYMSPSDYIEVAAKDTPMKVALKRTYEPKLCTFEQEIEELYHLPKNGEPQPTYWY